MTNWAQVLKQISPRAKKSIVDDLAAHMDAAFQHGQLTNIQRQAHFLARAAVETDGFCTLCEYWGPSAAQKRYEGRKDLGNVQKGDGKRFMGRGIFQLTGRANYQRLGPKIGLDLITQPERAAEGEASLKIAILYWSEHKLNAKADADDVLAICRAINGGTNGLSDQKLYLARAKKALGVPQESGAQIAGAQGSGTQSSGTQIAGLLDAGQAAQGQGQSQGQSQQQLQDQAQDLVHPLAREQVRALQQRLEDLGYPVGGIDGRVGTLTTGAISSYQHDHDLPISGQFDEATIASIWGEQDKRPISQDRALGEPDESRIVSDAKALKASSLIAGGGAGLSAATDALSNAEAAKGYYERISAVLEPFGTARDIIAAHPYVFVALAALALFLIGERIRRSRIEDHQSGKTL
jgi:putative chitinase